MKKFTTGLLHRTRSHGSSGAIEPIAVDSPESNAARAVRLFCESGSASNGNEEVLHLPVIVEAAESSPQAATAAAYQIRKFLSKECYGKPHVQYNAIMLIRILAGNPGPTFTRNFDQKFVTTTRDLLKNGKDASVQQILRETLDFLEADMSHDEGATPLLNMWRQEKGRGGTISPPTAGGRDRAGFNVPRFDRSNPPVPPSQQDVSQRVFSREQLPPPHELASRIEEAKNTGKILLQLVQSTPPEEVLTNDLLKEFGDRCQSAQRSLQGYINCDSPPPDDDTLQTLIEVNEQLSLALSRHQRALLSARRAAGATSTGPSPGPGESSSIYPPPPPPQSSQPTNLFASAMPPQRPAHDAVSPISAQEEFSYQAPPLPPPNLQSRLQDRHDEPRDAHNPFADSSTYDHDNDYTYPSEQANYGYSDAQHESHRPGTGRGYAQGPTPSYLGRQQSSGDNLTMHGAAESPEQHHATANGAYAGYGAGYHDGGAGDVSPVSTRNGPVTYRY